MGEAMTTEKDFDFKLADLKAFRAEFDKLGYLWSDDNIAKAYLGWKLAKKAQVDDPDGAAFRAAVEHGLHIGVEENTISAWHRDVFGNFQTEVRGTDPMGAARRAIDRAVKVLLRRKS